MIYQLNKIYIYKYRPRSRPRSLPTNCLYIAFLRMLVPIEVIFLLLVTCAPNLNAKNSLKNQVLYRKSLFINSSSVLLFCGKEVYLLSSTSHSSTSLLLILMQSGTIELLLLLCPVSDEILSLSSLSFSTETENITIARITI